MSAPPTQTTVDTLARSFDVALEQFIRIEGKDADTADNRGRLAARLVVLSRFGECEEDQLASNAVLYLRAFVAAMRLGSATSNPPPEVKPHAMALDPDAVRTTAEALAKCLEELPDGISSTVRKIIEAAVLESAGAGERDVEKIKSFALEKLRTRK